MLKLLIIPLLVTALSASPSSIGHAAVNTNTGFEQTVLTIVAPNRKPTKAKGTKNVFRRTREFLSFKLLGSVNTNVSDSLVEALKAYTGPTVGITSLRRHWNSKSAHNHGKAVDFEFSKELIEWLISDEGQHWLNNHSLMFYIESVPGAKCLKPYKADERYAQYVFENPQATGDHIHIGIKR